MSFRFRGLTPFWQGVVATLSMISVAFMLSLMWVYVDKVSQQKADTVAVTAFREKYGLPADTPVKVERSKGVTVYAFQKDGKTILYLGGNAWIELNEVKGGP